VAHTVRIEPGLCCAPEQLFTTTTVVGPDVQTVYVAGELDLNSNAEATAAFAFAVAVGAGLPIVVDLTDLDFMDCGGYRAIAAARHAAEQHGIALTPTHAHGEPARLLNLLGEPQRTARTPTARRMKPRENRDAPRARLDPPQRASTHTSAIATNTTSPSVDSSPKRTIPAQHCGTTLIAIAAGDQSACADLGDQIAPRVFAIMTLLGIRRTAPRYSRCEGSARAWCLNIAYQHAIRSHGAGHRPEVPDEH
jgi:anti-anti-sigma factor